MREVVITIDKEGNIVVEGFDFQGPECEMVIGDIASIIGETIEVEFKPEYYEVYNILRNRTGG